MSDEKVIIDLCSSDEEEDNFADENRFEEEIDETEDEEEADTSSRYFPNGGSFAYFNLSFLYIFIDCACCLFSEEDSDWSHDDATDSDQEYDVDNETGQKGHAAAAADDDDDKVTRLLTGW